MNDEAVKRNWTQVFVEEKRTKPNANLNAEARSAVGFGGKSSTDYVNL